MSEQKLHCEQPRTTTTTIIAVSQDCTNITKAIKKVKDKYIEKMVKKLEIIDVDPFTAWKASKQLHAGLSHLHVDTKNKHIKLKVKIGNLTAKQADQVQSQGKLFSKQVFSWNSPFDPNAINKLKAIPTNIAMVDPITLEKLNST